MHLYRTGVAYVVTHSNTFGLLAGLCALILIEARTYTHTVIVSLCPIIPTWVEVGVLCIRHCRQCLSVCVFFGLVRLVGSERLYLSNGIRFCGILILATLNGLSLQILELAHSRRAATNRKLSAFCDMETVSHVSTKNLTHAGEWCVAAGGHS